MPGTALSWGAPFSTQRGKVPKTTSPNGGKWLPKRIRKLQKAIRKRSQNIARKNNEICIQIGPKMEPQMRDKCLCRHPGETPGSLRKRFANEPSFFCRFWVPLGAFCPPLDAIFAFLGPFWTYFGPKIERQRSPKHKKRTPKTREIARRELRLQLQS